jgi:hypothetical protein
MRTELVSIYKFGELSDKAKERARYWYRQGAFDYEWWDSVYDDAAMIAERMGIDLKTEPVKLMGGGTRYDPSILFTGFWSQGDGACFEGTYQYRKDSRKLVRGYAPDPKLLQIVDGLYDVQRRNFYKVTASVKHRGHYYHEMCTEIDVDGCRTDSDIELVKDLLRDFMRWIYRQLEKEYDYLNSDESVDEMIVCNKYEFTEEGERA